MTNTAFTEEQETRLSELIAEAVAGAGKGAPKGRAADPKPAPTDDEWARMTPRQRESWVEDATRRELDRLKKSDKLEDLQAQVESLTAELRGTAAGGAASERAPKAWSWLTEFLWGKPAEGEES